MAFIEPCFGIGHNLSLICQMTSEDIKHQLIIIIIIWGGGGGGGGVLCWFFLFCLFVLFMLIDTAVLYSVFKINSGIDVRRMICEKVI